MLITLTDGVPGKIYRITEVPTDVNTHCKDLIVLCIAHIGTSNPITYMAVKGKNHIQAFKIIGYGYGSFYQCKAEEIADLNTLQE